ncbi:hypothetical protein [Glacieibacterium sp.]|uniref:hypothetical protein n=1 Tax=Glacieibacterium sp. TaxID=2860237 RepID=UPI003AFF7562
MAAPRSGTGETVPCVPFAFSVGVTGHRWLGDHEPALRTALTAVLGELRAAVNRVHAADPGAFAPQAPVLRLVSPLAAGADQLAAEAALDLGYELHAVLPFGREIYAEDFTEAAVLDRFHALAARATRTLELPCLRDEERSGYALAGRATTAHSDVLVGVWDGLPARGPGGTAEVIDHAVRRGVPVIHLPVDGGRPATLLWSAHDPHLTHGRAGEVAGQPLDAAAFDRLVRWLVAPPADPGQRACLAAFLAEAQRRARPRFEYPLLQALAGTRRLHRTTFWVPPFADAVRADWQAFRDGAEPLTGGQPLPLDLVENAYAWSDGLAAHFAQSYRSGHVFNFAFGAIAVLLGLSGLLMAQLKLWLAFAELAAIIALVLNTRVGTARNWHRRWLDYRQLAERLRPMRSLALVGAAQPDRVISRGAPNWVDWYAARIWRSTGMPSIRLTTRVAEVAELVVAQEIRPQIAYHRSSAASVRRLDHRLHQAGTILFVASCLSCLAFIVSYLLAHEWTAAHAGAFVALSAGLPAIGTAFFGIRVQGDFASTAARSQITADHLEAVADWLEAGGVTFQRAADGIEAAARVMFGDLGEWRTSHQQRQLEVG